VERRGSGPKVAKLSVDQITFFFYTHSGIYAPLDPPLCGILSQISPFCDGIVIALTSSRRFNNEKGTAMHKILLVEDSPEAGQFIIRTFGPSVQIEWVKTISDATQVLNRREFDLMILDGVLPDGDGFQFCSVLQTQERWKSMPIIMVTAKSSISDKVMAFSVGAEDHIAKPFEALELKARVEARLRKKEQRLRASDVIIINDIEINKRTQKVHLNENGSSQELDLTPREFKILLLLAGRPNVVISRDDILKTVWGENVHVFPRSVDTHVSKLRKKLGVRAAMIASVHGAGYRFRSDSKASAPMRMDFGSDGAEVKLQLGHVG
jgi:DNA-binding response OmpR family regulator